MNKDEKKDWQIMPDEQTQRFIFDMNMAVVILKGQVKGSPAGIPKDLKKEIIEEMLNQFINEL